MSVFSKLDSDKSIEGLEFKRRIKQALIFGGVGVALLVVIGVFPSENQYTGVLPGICLGMAAALTGSAVNRYKKQQKGM
ncbi:MAG: hypothetical protein IBX55_01800 [Methyloprofundus sp.]|nr:hypothetical protein [Methyloprofundus sp.]